MAKCDCGAKVRSLKVSTLKKQFGASGSLMPQHISLKDSKHFTPDSWRCDASGLHLKANPARQTLVKGAR